MGDLFDLIGNVSSIYSYCNGLNEGFIRYKNHAKYLNDLALQLDSIYKLSENRTLLAEKEKEFSHPRGKDKNKEKDNGVNNFVNYKNELEGSIPPVIIHFYNYTKKFMSHVKKIKSKNFVERLWYLSVNDEKMDGLEEELDFIMKQFQIDTFSLIHGYVKNQKDMSITNLNKEVPAIPQSKEESTEDKMKRKEKEMKKKTKEFQKREYELVKELERLRRKNEKERKRRREIERMEEYRYYKEILENDEKLYKKMLVRVPIPNSPSNTNPPNLSSTNTNLPNPSSTTNRPVSMGMTTSRSQNFGSMENLEDSPYTKRNKLKNSNNFSLNNLTENNNHPENNINPNTKEKNIPYMTDNNEEQSKSNTQPNSTIIDVFKKNEYEYIVKTMNMVNHTKANPKLYELAIKLLGYMKRKSKVADETKTLPSWFIDETNMDVLDDKNSFIGSGSYCYVQKCIYNGALVAKKTLNYESSDSKEGNIDVNEDNNIITTLNEKEMFLREIEIWSQIKSHPNILQFYGACHISQHPSILSEYCSQGTVKSYTSKKAVSPEQKLQIMHGIITGLYHLHQNNIIHGDIKSDNILITENGKPKICDFGLSVIQTDQNNRLFGNNQNNNKLNTLCKITDAIRWKAPELFSEYKIKNIINYFDNGEDVEDFNNFTQNGDRDYNEVIGKISVYSDIFSVGRLFYEIIFQKIPFFDIINEVQVEYMIIHNKFPSKFKINNSALERNILYSNKMWDILEKTWRYDPFDRISLMTIATLLIQLRNQQLHINNELKELSKQNYDEVDTLNNNATTNNNTNNNTTITTTTNNNNNLNVNSSKKFLSTNNLDVMYDSNQNNSPNKNSEKFMKHSVSISFIDSNEKNDTDHTLDDFNPVRHHRRSISDVEISTSTLNLAKKTNSSMRSLDKLKHHSVSRNNISSNQRVPKSMMMNNNIDDYHPNSSQIANSKQNSLEINHDTIISAKSANDIYTLEDKNYHGSSRLEKPKLCVRIETILDNNNTKISLDKENISGRIPEEIGNYTDITELCLAYNKLKGSIPYSIGSLANLTILRLHGNALTGRIPESLFVLRNLVELRLDHNNLTDELPSSIGDLKKLTHLYLSHNKLTGKIPEKIGNLKNLVHLIMQDNQFVGSIPESIGNLTNLTHLYMAQNSLKGEIPQSFKNLEQLSVLILNENKLSGEIPEFICNFSRLSQLWLSYNNFSGSLPSNIGKLTRLKILQIHNNPSLEGPIPSSINNLKRLEHLTYCNTKITGSPSKELIQRLKIFEHD